MPVSLGTPFTQVVDAPEAGLRLDAYVALRLVDHSRSRVAGLIRQGCIQVDGDTRKPGYRVKKGEIVTGCIQAPTAPDLVPEPIPINVLFEDRSIIVVNKASGMVVHPAAGHITGTLVHALLHHCPDLQGIGGERRPGIVHRLDKDTSGVMVAAKNEAALTNLANQFKLRRVKKQYLALVRGVPEGQSGCIRLPVGRHAVDRKRMAVVHSRGREACTCWQVCERFTGSALLSLDLKTGRTHQIRVHCQAIGHPIIGDPVYGSRRCAAAVAGSNVALVEILRDAERQMLHAARLGFAHPENGLDMTFEAPLPEDMAVLVRKLRDHRRTTAEASHFSAPAQDK